MIGLILLAGSNYGATKGFVRQTINDNCEGEPLSEGRNRELARMLNCISNVLEQQCKLYMCYMQV